MEKRHIRRENKVKQVLTEKHVLSRVAHEFVVKLWFTFQVRPYPFDLRRLRRGAQATRHALPMHARFAGAHILTNKHACMHTCAPWQDADSLYLVLDLATGGELLSVIQHHREQALAAGLGPQVGGRGQSLKGVSLSS